jgi:ferritin
MKELIDPLKAGLAHEKYITASINDIYAAAEDSKDYRTQEFLGWFIKEQGEEELDAGNQVRQFEMYGSDPKTLYLLDKAAGERK